jgi:hypothetical protein
VVAGASAALSGRGRTFDTIAAVGFTFACILLEWPLLTAAYVFVRYWTTGQAIGE